MNSTASIVAFFMLTCNQWFFQRLN